MKTELKLIKLLILFLVFYAGYVPGLAQQIKLVSGRVLDKESKLPFKDEAVYIYAFNTVAAAVEAKKVIDSSSGAVFSDGQEIADEGGYYEIRVAETGALIFKVGLGEAVLKEVDYQMEINAFIDAGIVLETVEVTGTLQDIAPKEAAPTLIGNKLIMRNSFPIPSQFGKTNARLIIQPYVMVCDNQDTVAFTRPMVYDGEQYRLTQERRMLYNLKNDPLVEYASDVPLTENSMRIDWEDTVMVPDPTKNYYGNAIIQLEDYNMVYYNKLTKIISCEAKRPLKFLEYSLDKYSLDFNDYKRRAKRELRNTAANVSLTFLVNKAEIDNKDPNNEVQLNELRNNLMNIINCEDCTLKEIHVTGVSSPEGNYQSNLALAQRRAVFAKNQLNRMLPTGALSRTFMPAPDARVAEWSELIPVLKADSCFKEADEMNPNIAVVKQQLSVYEAESGAAIEAYGHIEDALALEPDVPVYNIQAAQTILFFRDEISKEKNIPREELDKKMIFYYRRAAELAPGDSTLQWKYARAFYDVKNADWNAALKQWDFVLENCAAFDVEKHTALENMARVLIELNRDSEAEGILKKIDNPNLSDSKNALLAEIVRAKRQKESEAKQQ